MNTPDQLIQKLRASGRFVFTYRLNDDERELSEQHQRARFKIHFEKALDAYFSNRPSVAKYRNEVERF